jgi:hypothetical protein
MIEFSRAQSSGQPDITPGGDPLAQSRGEIRKSGIHAVFVWGWFSATAEAQDSNPRRHGKAERMPFRNLF